MKKHIYIIREAACQLTKCRHIHPNRACRNAAAAKWRAGSRKYFSAAVNKITRRKHQTLERNVASNVKRHHAYLICHHYSNARNSCGRGSARCERAVGISASEWPLQKRNRLAWRRPVGLAAERAPHHEEGQFSLLRLARRRRASQLRRIKALQSKRHLSAEMAQSHGRLARGNIKLPRHQGGGIYICVICVALYQRKWKP